MESEKVKEIKKALEVYGNENKGITILRGGEIQSISYADILTLINELESENERWQEKEGALSCDLDLLNEKLTNAEIEVDDYKDRIAELEKENAKLLDSVESVQAGRCIYKCKLTKEHLTKFAERLKEKFPKNDFITFSSNSHINKEIDETLKEFIDD